MGFSFFCSRINVLLLLAFCSSCKFIQGPMDFEPLKILQTTTSASLDFGRIFFNPPSAVLRPQNPEEISQLLTFLSASSFSKVTVAARGAGHSIYGQAQALNGIVIEMDSLPPSIKIHRKRDGEPGLSYADVSGGTLWVDLLRESLKVGLAPRSWTDYLYLSIGGTLSNAGISGQTFKYGPQISNVLQLDVVTGRGELVTCSPVQSPDLFYSVLGGLGQFGVITSARILLEDAPEKVKMNGFLFGYTFGMTHNLETKTSESDINIISADVTNVDMVKWIRAFYDNFEIFTKDQELLVSMENKVDYVEGFMVLNEQSLQGSSVSFPSYMGFIQQRHATSSDVFYCIEFAVHCHLEKESSVDQVVEEISKQLSYMPSFIYSVEVSYFDFLNRVRMEEMSLRSRGLWEVSHPWLNMLVPKSGIAQFRDLLLENITPHTFEGHILIYPLLRNKWNSNSSAVLPDSGDDDVIYIVSVLRSANPTTCSTKCLAHLLNQNHRVIEAATESRIGAKQYLCHHSLERQWREHFGGKWERFLTRKSEFDPLHILAPGQGIFQRKYSQSQ